LPFAETRAVRLTLAAVVGDQPEGGHSLEHQAVVTRRFVGTVDPDRLDTIWRRERRRDGNPKDLREIDIDAVRIEDVTLRLETGG